MSLDRPLPPGFPRFKVPRNDAAGDAIAGERQLALTPAYGRDRARQLMGLSPKQLDRAQRAELKSERHLALLRQCPCVITLHPHPGEVHHLKCTGERGVGKKSSDCWALPIVRDQHLAVEHVGPGLELTFFNRYGIDPLGLAWQLWQRTGDLENMRATVYVTVMYSGRGNGVPDLAASSLATIDRPWVAAILAEYDAARRAGAL